MRKKKILRNLSLADSGEHSIRISARRFTTANPILCRVWSRKAAVTHYYLPRRGQQDALAGGHCSALGKEKRLCPEPEVCGERQQGAAQPERAGAGGSLLPRRAKGCSRWRANSKQAMRTASKTDSGPVVLLGTGWSWCGFSPVAGEVNRRVTHWE